MSPIPGVLLIFVSCTGTCFLLFFVNGVVYFGCFFAVIRTRYADIKFLSSVHLGLFVFGSSV